ncbi:MAG: cupredoxin domain-containing protein [Caldilineales bacterium]|nr:cupredoxin domain-containing protein [Caldilineales bacterium]
MRPAILVALTILLALAALLIPLPLAEAAPVEHRIELDARMFAFTPSRVEVNRGDTVTITLRSEDVVHGVYVDGYDVNIIAEPGKPAQASFIADRRGKFRFRCSVTCGSLHPFMIGELVVGPNLPFWRASAALLVVVVGTMLTLGVRREDVKRET